MTRTNSDSRPSSIRMTNISTNARGFDSTGTTPMNGVFQNVDRQSSEDVEPVEESEDFEDVADDPDTPIPGWPRVAKLMAETPDFAAFSRFRDLNIKSLLYYQAELTLLRKKLHVEEWNDFRDGDEENAKKFFKRADRLVSSKSPNNKQWNLVLDMRRLLKEYNEALLQYSQISELSQPETMNMRCLRKWLEDPDGCYFGISGRGEQNTWGDLYEPSKPPVPLRYQFAKVLWSLVRLKPATEDLDLDLVVARRPEKIDGLSRWVSTDFIPFWTECRKRWRSPKKEADEESIQKPKTSPASATRNKKRKKKAKKEFKKDTLATFAEMNILRFTSAISTIVACLLPTIAITVLAQVHETRNLLLCLAAFAVIFAGGLIFLTSGTASRVEVFAATAAFSAVLVVFISNPTPVPVQIVGSN